MTRAATPPSRPAPFAAPAARIAWVLLPALLLFSVIPAASAVVETPGPNARLVVDHAPPELAVSAVCAGPECGAPGLTYAVAAEKNGPSGTSRSVQGGAVDGDGVLSTIHLLVGGQDRYRITLSVLLNGEVIATDTIQGAPAP